MADCNLAAPMHTTDAKSYMVQQCQPGYYGPLCSMCLKDHSPPYGRSGAWNCKPCRQHSSIIIAYIASTLLVWAFLDYTIQVTLKDNERQIDPDEPPQASELIRVCPPLFQHTVTPVHTILVQELHFERAQQISTVY